MKIVILLFDRLTVLDAVGPLEVLAQLPGAEVQFVAPLAGVIHSDSGGLTLNAPLSIDDVDRADVLLVPGGIGTRALVKDARVLDWVRRVDATTTWTTSVCTGALVLAAAGLLAGRPATTHWIARSLLSKLGALPSADRVVFSGKYASAAGVSAGIDLALALAGRIAGDLVAQGIQLAIEYDPQPPYDAGSLDKAPDPVVAAVTARFMSRPEATTPVDPGK